ERPSHDDTPLPRCCASGSYCGGLDLRTTGRPAGRSQRIVESFERRIPITGPHRRHVEYMSDVRTTAPDTAPPLERAALEGIRCNADQSRDLVAAQATELGQQPDERASQHWSDTWHRDEQPIAVSECRIGCNDLDQALVKHLDVGGEPSDAAARKTLQHRIFEQSCGVLRGDFLCAELAADGEHFGEPFGCRRP